MNRSKFNVHFGLGFTPKKASKTFKEIHSRIINKFSRFKVIYFKINEINAEVLIGFNKISHYYKRKRYIYLLVNYDVFST